MNKKIARELEMSVSSAKTILREYRKRGHVLPAPGTRRPRITDEQTDLRITRAVGNNQLARAAELAAAVTAEGTDVTPVTVRTRLRTARLHGRSARKKPFLAKIHEIKRLAYAKRMLSAFPREFDLHGRGVSAIPRHS